MLDSDLPKLYQLNNGTKEINQAVKNNLEKFPKNFSWVLDKSEQKVFLVKIFDQKNNVETRVGKYKNPRVFNEFGILMLATILKTEIATKITIAIIDTFVKLRKYVSNSLLVQEHVNNLVYENHERLNVIDQKILSLQECLNKTNENKKINEVFFNGQIYDAYSAIMKIFESASNELIIIDNYADRKVLDMISKLNTKVYIVTKAKSLLTTLDINNYMKQYSNLEVRYSNSYHDRFFIVDRKIVYHCGASINHAGAKVFAINNIEEISLIKTIINNVTLIL